MARQSTHAAPEPGARDMAADRFAPPSGRVARGVLGNRQAPASGLFKS
jgi:hypothetical protein